MELSLISLANDIGGKGWSYILEAIFFLLVIAAPIISAKNRTRYFFYTFWSIVGLFLLRAIALTYLLYVFWSKSAPGIYFLPPYQPIAYVVGYSFFHFYFSFLLGLGIISIVSLCFFLFNKYRGYALQEGDIALYACCAMIVRWPLMVPYTLTALVAAALFVVVRGYILNGSRVVLLAPSLLAMAIPFLFLSVMMLDMFHLRALLLPL